MSTENGLRAGFPGAWFQGSGEALILFEPAGGRVVDANPEALRLTGYEADAIRGLTLDRLLAGPAAGPQGLERLTRVGRWGGGVVRAGEGFALRGRDDRSVAVRLVVSRARGGDEPLGLLAAAAGPITAPDPDPDSDPDPAPGPGPAFPGGDDAAALLFEPLLRLGTDLLCVAGPDGQFVWVSPAWEGCLGHPVADLLRGPVARFFHPDDRDRPGPDAPTRFESRAVHSDGGERRLAWRATVAGGLFYGAARDLTADGDRSDAADRARAEFLASMSHEIRTPLTAILGFGDLVADRLRAPALADAVGPECLEHLQAIRRNGERLQGLLADVLDVTRLESGDAPVVIAPCSPARVVADVTAALGAAAEAKGLTLDVEYRTAVPATVHTDAARLRRILAQVVGNALKFTERGGVRLAVGLDGPRLVVEVADTGIGMTAAELARVFQPFYRADTSRRRPRGGTGLGLAVSRGLAEQLGATLDARSTPGSGSVFTLALPAGPAGAEAPLVAPGAPAPKPALDARVLVAEDNRDNQQIISIRLNMAGAQVELAPNGRVAVEMALAARAGGRPFDLVLMDMQMPVLDGYEATRLLRSEGVRAPIVALTAHANPEDRLECLRFGCDDFVSKPIDWAALFSLLNRLLDPPSPPA